MSNPISLSEQVDVISSRLDFMIFLEALLADFEADPASWENHNLSNYLGALAAWIADMDGYYLNRAEEVPENVNWKVFGQMLLAAKYYE